MRVVMIGKALVVAAYQRKAEEIARLGVELTVLTPPFWQDRRGRQVAQPGFTQGYHFEMLPVRWNGNYHLHHYPTLAHRLAQLRPQVVHLDEEPYNLATWLGLRAAERVGARSLFFTWQNLYKRYPPPFRWLEQDVYRRVALAITGNAEAATVLRRKGYPGAISVIPQFGVDPTIFVPLTQRPSPSAALQIGYAGGLLPEKGVASLMRACAGLRGAWQLHLAGGGSEQASLLALANRLGVAGRIRWHGSLPSTAMPTFYQGLDLFVLPSRTQRTWKEQFGRVLIEAMACGVPVIGSTCGEIPNVIGDAGLVFAENEEHALQSQLQRLADNPAERVQLAAAGRQRVLDHFTMRRIAEETVAAYQRLLQTHK